MAPTTTPIAAHPAAGQRQLQPPLRQAVLGHVIGTVTKEATRVRVVFDSGIPPLDLAPIQAGDRFPVNFYSGFYRLPAKERRPATWQVVRVEAYDQAGRKVAECQAAAGPGHSC